MEIGKFKLKIAILEALVLGQSALLHKTSNNEGIKLNSFVQIYCITYNQYNIFTNEMTTLESSKFILLPGKIKIAQ